MGRAVLPSAESGAPQWVADGGEAAAAAVDVRATDSHSLDYTYWDNVAAR